MTEMRKVYAAQYNPCYHESSYGTLSLHRTFKGAMAATMLHRADELVMWKELGHDDVPEYELWRVQEFEVLE